jgi:hypothetical protein
MTKEPLPAPDSIEPDRIYPRLTVAKLLGRSPQTVDRWCAAGVLDARKIGVRAKGITGASVRRVLAGEEVA